MSVARTRSHALLDLLDEFPEVDGPEENRLEPAFFELVFIGDGPAGDDPNGNPPAPVRELSGLDRGISALRDVSNQ